ncbi:MAG: hypothetical protein J6D61_04975 [Clostridia bacterium]|nr:hypothetical protein [Clostridia bacterium]MBP3588496.1 hypothetical protein [Clostridia bacterium]
MRLYLSVSETGSAVLVSLFGLLIMAYGVFCLLKPEIVWKLEHLGRRWMYRDAEPTSDAIIWIRIVGGASIVGGIFFILIMLKVTQGERGLL